MTEKEKLAHEVVKACMVLDQAEYGIKMATLTRDRAAERHEKLFQQLATLEEQTNEKE